MASSFQVRIHILSREVGYLSWAEWTQRKNKKHENTKFTSEKEVNISLPFSDFNSFIADEYKNGLIFTLLFRVFSIVLDFSKFHKEISNLKDALKKNSFPTNLVDKLIKIFLNEQFS